MRRLTHQFVANTTEPGRYFDAGSNLHLLVRSGPVGKPDGSLGMAQRFTLRIITRRSNRRAQLVQHQLFFTRRFIRCLILLVMVK